MAPISEPGPTPQLCPRCGTRLPELKHSHCPNCGAFLRQRSIWVTVAAVLGALLLGGVALCLGAFAAVVALFASGESGNARDVDVRSAWGISVGAVVCAVAAIAIVVWLLKKPKPKP